MEGGGAVDGEAQWWRKRAGVGWGARRKVGKREWGKEDHKGSCNNMQNEVN